MEIIKFILYSWCLCVCVCEDDSRKTIMSMFGLFFEMSLLLQRFSFVIIYFEFLYGWMNLINYNYCLSYWQLNCFTKSLSLSFFFLEDAIKIMISCFVWNLAVTFDLKNNKSLLNRTELPICNYWFGLFFLYAFNLCICVTNLFGVFFRPIVLCYPCRQYLYL